MIVSGGAEAVAGEQGPVFQRDGQQGAEVREVNGDDVRAEVRQADGVASRTRSRRPMGEGGRAGGKS